MTFPSTNQQPYPEGLDLDSFSGTSIELYKKSMSGNVIEEVNGVAIGTVLFVLGEDVR